MDLYHANCGNIWGPKKVAKNYWLGQGIEEDPKEAYFWYGVVAKEWDREAAKNRWIVGNLLTPEDRAEIDARVEAWAPRDCPKDAKPDFLRLRHLADLDRAACGNVWAQLQVAKDYKSGYGTEKDPKESYFWYARAAEDWGFRRAAFEREAFSEELSTKERAEIDARVAAWVPPDCPSAHPKADS